MTAEAKRAANQKNQKKAKTLKTAANGARCPEDAGWVEPKKAHGDFNVPLGHRLGRQPPRALRKNVGGLLSKWKNTMRTPGRTKALWKADALNQYAPGGPALERCRHTVSRELLAPLGMEAWPCVKDLQTPAGREAALKHVLWPSGPKLGDLLGDALPNMPSLTVTDDTLHTVWDLLFTVLAKVAEAS